MTTKDAAPTYIAVLSREGSKIHLSADGDYTLCRWVIQPDWPRHTERVPFISLLLAAVDMCAACERAALAVRKK